MTLINQIWDFFASVKLAITTLCSLAITSIIGTVIPQGESSAFYVKQYGIKTAQFFQILDIPEMYYSWWFLGLLGILAVNLIICSLERFPAVWKIINADNLTISTSRLEKMQNNKSWSISNNPAVDKIHEVLRLNNWKCVSKDTENNTLLFGERGKYSRTGVYMVHLSILVIFVGATIGYFYGFKGSVMIPEQLSTTQAFSYGDSKPIQFGFDVRCNKFEIEFYDNGMPKEYTSSLTIIQNGQEIITKSIEVNKPLSYKGFTFYQSSYQGYQDFIFEITDKQSKTSESFTVPFQKQESWKEGGIQFGVINAEAIAKRVVRSKIWFKAPGETAFTGWLDDNQSIDISIGEKQYNVYVKQMYATGLQVAKDPGVWTVYLGCVLMLLGLYMAFFMSHQRLWVLIDTSPNNGRLYLSGTTNKNRITFRHNFVKLEQQIDKILEK